jgi:hypothetical protein
MDIPLGNGTRISDEFGKEFLDRGGVGLYVEAGIGIS